MVHRFEDLIAWQKARALTKLIYEVTARSAFTTDRPLTDQMRRAAVSCMSNIAEGFERGNPGDFHRFLSVSKSSCGELLSQLYVCLDVGYLHESQFAGLAGQMRELSRILGRLRASQKLARALRA